MDEQLGTVTIAPYVLTTIVRQTTLEQRGISRLVPVAPKMRGWLGTGAAAEEGIFVAVTDAGVQVEVHVAADNGINLLKLGEAVQDAIIRAIEDMVGMSVASVDVHIDDVVLAAAQTRSES